MKKVVAISVYIAVFTLLCIPLAASAQFSGQLVPDPWDKSGAYQLCDLVRLAQNIIRFAVYASVLVAAIMFAYAGVLYVTAAANPEQIKKAHGIFMKVFIGIVIILTSWLIVDVVMKTLTEGKFGPWNDIPCEIQPQPTGTVSNANLLKKTNENVASRSCPTCSDIKAFKCRAANSCSASDALNNKLNVMKDALGTYSTQTIVTESGPTNADKHILKEEYLNGTGADISCETKGAGGTCSNDWASRNQSAAQKAGLEFVYETNSAADYEAKKKAGINAKLYDGVKNPTTGTCTAGPSGSTVCITGAHASIRTK